ncbi:hypothetical protein IKE67_08660 [bacterium]|nr:hypothetical protein [bacterium]
MENHEIESEIEYTTTIIQDGREYFQSYAHQLAKHICSKSYSEFELSAEYGFTSAKIFFQSVDGGSTFEKTRKSPKKCIGNLLFNIDNNEIILRKYNVQREIHEFHKGECFGVQYEIFKYLRDCDWIQICTVETVNGKNVKFIYSIKKLKAMKNGKFLHFAGHGTQFFIPVADFSKSTGREIKEVKKKQKKEK